MSATGRRGGGYGPCHTEAPIQPQPPILTRAFGLLVGAHFLQALGYSSMILLPLYLDFLGASRAQIGSIMAVSALGGLAVRPLVGIALDRVGRKPTLYLGTAVLVLGMLGVGGIEQPGAVAYLVRIVVGVGTATLFTSYFTFAADLVPEVRRTEGLALFGISGLVPLLVNPLAGQLGITGGQLRWFFPALGLLVAASVLFLWPIPERRSASPEPLRAVAVLTALREPALLPVWLATTVFSSLVAVFMAFSTVVAADREIDSPGVLWLAYAAGAVSVRLLGARLPARVGPSLVVPPALLAYGAALWLTARTDQPLGLAVAGGLAGIGHGYAFPVLAGQVVTRIRWSLRGSAMSLFTALWDLSKLLLVPAAGALADRTDDETMLVSVAAAGLLGVVIWGGLEAALGPGLGSTRAAAPPTDPGKPA